MRERERERGQRQIPEVNINDGFGSYIENGACFEAWTSLNSLGDACVLNALYVL